MTSTVAHVSNMSGWGGVERMLLDLLLADEPKECRHFLLATSYKHEILQPLVEHNIPHLRRPIQQRYHPQTIRQLTTQLSENGTSIIHGYNAYANVWGYLLAKMGKVPAFYAGEHGTIWRTTPPMAWLDRFIHRHATATIANSHATAGMLQKKYRLDPTKIHIVPNAIPPLPIAPINDLRRQWGFDDKTVIGSVGRLNHIKNYTVLLETATQLLPQFPQICFVLVGGGEQEQSLRQRATDLGIADRFHFTGWRNDARVLVQLFDIFVSTSLTETFGNGLAEASLAGVPVVAPAVGGIPEVVQHGVTGQLLTPSIDINTAVKTWQNGQVTTAKGIDPSLLANVLAQLIRNPEQRQAWGNAGKKHAQTHFNMARYIQNLEKIYLHKA